MKNKSHFAVLGSGSNRSKSNKVTDQVASMLMEQLKNAGQSASVGKIRVLPSTLIDISEDKYQFMANSFVSVKSQSSTATVRPELVNSVVTVRRVPQQDDVVETVKVPALLSSAGFSSTMSVGNIGKLAAH